MFQGRIKKIMQTDDEVGKVAQAVPVIIYILLFHSLNNKLTCLIQIDMFCLSSKKPSYSSRANNNYIWLLIFLPCFHEIFLTPAAYTSNIGNVRQVAHYKNHGDHDHEECQDAQPSPHVKNARNISLC